MTSLRGTLIAAALFVLPLAFWPWARDAYSTVKAAGLAAYALPAVVLWTIEGRPGLAGIPRWHLAALAGWLAWTFARVPGAGDPVSAWLEAGAAGLALAGAAACLGLDARSRDRARGALLASTACAAAVGLAQSVFGRRFLSPFDVDARSVTFTAERVFSTFGNPIFFAGFLAAVLPLALAALVAPGRHGRIAAAAVVLLGLAALMITGSRGPLIGLAAGAAWLAWRHPPARRWVAAAAAAGVVAAGLASLRWPGLAAHFVAGGDPGRVVMWRTVAKMWSGAPLLGVGTGQLALRFPCAQAATASPSDPGFGVNAIHAHNDYLEAGAELGWPGALLLAAALLGWLLRRPADATGHGAQAGLVAVAVNALFNFPLHVSPTRELVWMLPALFLSSGGAARPPRTAVAAVALLLAVVPAALAVRPLARSSYHQWALAYQDARALDRAERCLLKAASILPDDAQSRLDFNLGRVRLDGGDVAGAQARFEEDLKRYPCFPEAYGSMSVVHGMRASRGESGARETAEAFNRRALELRPNGREAAGDWNTRGNLKVLAGDERGALESYERALACDPATLEGAVNLIRLRLKRRERREAEAAVRAALPRHPESAELRDIAGRLGIR